MHCFGLQTHDKSKLVSTTFCVCIHCERIKNKILKTLLYAEISFPEFHKVPWFMECRKTLYHVLISNKASKSTLVMLMKSISSTLKPTPSSRDFCKEKNKSLPPHFQMFGVGKLTSFVQYFYYTLTTY